MARQVQTCFMKGLINMWKPSIPSGSNNSPAPVEPQRQPSIPPPVPEYNNSTPKPMTSATAVSDQATIGKSLVIKGEVTGSESLYIDGRVEGSIHLPGNRVTVGRNGVVAANITAREAVILGKVRGNVTATDRVDIRNEGSLTGDVVAQRISIEDGAFFKGGIDIRKPNVNDKPQTVEGSAAATDKDKAAVRA
jgi:cytoskeletal protein CcmA (bactofilin family)